MAQATLVSLALASAAGSVGGELGVAAMIMLATILLHGLAFIARVEILPRLESQQAICGLAYMQFYQIR